MSISLRAITPKRHLIGSPQSIKNNLRKEMVLYLLEVQAQMVQYPPKQERSQSGRRYKRTYKLGLGWLAPGAIDVNHDGTNGTLINRVPYAVYAQGPRGGGRGKGNRQTTYMRRIGWQSITDVARKTRKRYATLMNRAVKGSVGTL